MRSDREEIPAGATKEMADKAETMEARQRMSRAAPGCQTYWPFPYEVCGAIRDKYNSLGGPGSFLSYPNSPEYTNPDGYGKRTQFLNGPIYWSPQGGAHPVVNSFLNRWGIHGYEAGWLKYPTTDEILLPDGGRRQEFEFGAIYVAFQNAVGSAIRNGPLRDKYNSVGGLTPAGTLLGYPIQDQVGLPDGQGQMDRFQNGVIYWSPGTGAHPVTGPILSQWGSAGYEQSSFGYPTADAVSETTITVRQQFQSSTIYTPGTKVPLGTSGLSLTYGVPTTSILQATTIPDGLTYSSPGYNISFRVDAHATLTNAELTILNNQAPQQFRLIFGLPSGYSLTNSGNTVSVVGPAGVVADISNPIAADANKVGVSVQTSIEGNQVVYQFAPSSAWPITAVQNVAGASDLNEQYNPYYAIGGHTALVCEAAKYDCARSIRAFFDSKKHSEEHYSDRIDSQGKYLYEDDQLDADRHCLWQAMTTEAANAAFATQLGDAHETDKPSGTEAGIMDQYNNVTGRAVGLRHEDDVAGIISTCNAYADDALIVAPEDIDSVDQSNPTANSLIALFAP